MQKEGSNKIPSPSSVPDSKSHFSPLRLFFVTIAGIFVAEVIAMIAVYVIEPLPYYQITLMDATFMVVMIFPILYLFSFRPLIQHIEKLQRVESALQQKEELQKRFFDSIDMLIAYMDREFNFIRVNDAYAAAGGHPPEYFIGRNHFALYPHKENEEIFRRVVETGEAYSIYEKPFEYPDQPEIGVTYWNWSLQPVKDQDGKVEGVVLSLVDVTERKKAEIEIRERNEKERLLTQTIHNMQLDIARDLHDTIGQNISFLRMKLDYLVGKRTKKQAEMQGELRAMARAANESYDLMRGTLAILQSVDSTDLFRLFTRYAEQIEERAAFKAHLVSRGDPKPLSAPRMRQLFYIFREILNNIERHANASQVCVEMFWNTDHLSLTVSDNGIGFDTAQVQFGGHYGLRFMRERVKLLNGSLGVHSGIGSGTKIEVRIPYM